MLDYVTRVRKKLNLLAPAALLLLDIEDCQKNGFSVEEAVEIALHNLEQAQCPKIISTP